ncbi:hypothetical protein IIA95_02535 [Patescibacteria group bacterium]|nr:hypothetical protein [Patescibacteria group bacterium]
MKKLKNVNPWIKVIVILILLTILFTLFLKKGSDKFNYRVIDENNNLSVQFYDSYFLQINSPVRILTPFIESYSYIQIGKFYQWEKDENNKDYLGSILGERCDGINCFYYRCHGIHMSKGTAYGYTFYDGEEFNYETCYGFKIGKKSDIIY